MFLFMNKLRQPLTTTVVSIIILLAGLVPLLSPTWQPVFSTFLNLWMLIKRRPFIIYILANFIILSLLLLKVSSNKPKKTTIHLHHEQPVVPTSSGCADVSEILFSWGPGKDDTWTWWCQIINGSDESLEKEIYNEKSEKDETEGGSDVRSLGGGEKGKEEEGDDTLDATWRGIMEAKKKRSGPQLKKSDTWTTGRKGRLISGYDHKLEMKKWLTFNETGGEKKEERENSGGGGWRRMEVVITEDHEELKKRADAFIERFTHDMRLQRLESDQRFLEMINRGL